MNGLPYSSTPDDSLPYEVWLVYDDGRPDEFINACRSRKAAQAFLDEWYQDGSQDADLGVKPVLRVRDDLLPTLRSTDGRWESLPESLVAELPDDCRTQLGIPGEPAGGCVMVPVGFTVETIRQRVDQRRELLQALGEEFEVEYHPLATAGDDTATMGHMLAVTFVGFDPFASIDARETDHAGQVAAWLRRQAEELTTIAARIDAAKGGAT